ncbi:MAG: hypothetical protein IPM29_00375 [Planctomycetes bacterium]|nr:hypothetical protein [Planctomycetota bacterium]
MIVPSYWAEARLRHRVRDRQVTVRRFGWSDDSVADAQAMADERARAAIERIFAGERLARREPKMPYNGAAGVPIREEIVARHLDSVVTRNSYGARCLNTPDVLIADVDSPTGPPGRLFLAVLVAFAAGAYALWSATGSWLVAIVAFVVSLVLVPSVAILSHGVFVWVRGGAEGMLRRRLGAFVAARPDWRVALYRTPAGFRAMALHRCFAPDDPETRSFFRALRTDPIYVRMCLRQQCFRARVSAKPWRIGIDAPIRPRRGVWPVDPSRLPERERWVAAYEQRASGFAACELVDELGSLTEDHKARAVREFHDRLCRARSGLPIA